MEKRILRAPTPLGWTDHTFLFFFALSSIWLSFPTSFSSAMLTFLSIPFLPLHLLFPLSFLIPFFLSFFFSLPPCFWSFHHYQSQFSLPTSPSSTLTLNTYSFSPFKKFSSPLSTFRKNKNAPSLQSRTEAINCGHHYLYLCIIYFPLIASYLCTLLYRLYFFFCFFM